ELVARPVVRAADLVAARAGNVAALVGAAGAVAARAALMAERVYLVLVGRRHLAEAVRHRVGRALQMLGGIAVAGGAAGAGDRGARVGLGAVLAAPHNLDARVAVRANLAGADVVVGLGSGVGRGLGLSGGRLGRGLCGWLGQGGSGKEQRGEESEERGLGCPSPPRRVRSPHVRTS